MYMAVHTYYAKPGQGMTLPAPDFVAAVEKARRSKPARRASCIWVAGFGVGPFEVAEPVTPPLTVTRDKPASKTQPISAGF